MLDKENTFKTDKYIEIQNRRYLGNKFRLLSFIEKIVKEKCKDYRSFCDVFAGTGVVGSYFNKPGIKIISNDILHSNYTSNFTFLGINKFNKKSISKKIDYFNKLNVVKDNYFSDNYGNKYFTLENARIIGAIRDLIDVLSDDENEKKIMLTSLIYAVDKVANTVGHYDAYRKNLDSRNRLIMYMPLINTNINNDNEIYREDANSLVKKIETDVMYIDPPYNSRQYCDSYHLLENLARWDKPELFGKTKKMDRSGLKSKYCLKDAPAAFSNLIENAKCLHILVSYNNTGNSKDSRSNARISDSEILDILKQKGSLQIFERDYKAFTTGKSFTDNNSERIFYCRIKG